MTIFINDFKVVKMCCFALKNKTKETKRYRSQRRPSMKWQRNYE